MENPVQLTPRFTQAVEKIKDPVLFNLQFLPRPLKGLNQPTLPEICPDEHDDSGGE